MAKSVAKELEIELKEGIVATGDQFIASVEKKEWIVATFGADAVEMGPKVSGSVQLTSPPCMYVVASFMLIWLENCPHLEHFPVGKRRKMMNC